ncbi:spermatogenesis- and oogenesis-specific basic helix-loop-helix-containing protein 1 isoform X2 [Oryctolagus cuniculus]|uniref:spermatogenesis- and oogenesis-specific basic helix-loop-helix-containing protein 1 isoform X2 n=1 Tax=Oryctolagus cuniculus TaxID=9986 RepID=UPI0038798212
MRAAKGLGAGAGSTRGAARMARAWAGARSRQRAPGLWRLWLGPRGQRAGPTCQGGVRAHVVGGAHVPGRGPRAGAGPSSGVGAGGRVPCFSLFLRRGLMASWSADSEAGASRLPVFRGSSPPTTAPGLLLAFSGVPDSGCSPPSVPAGSMDAAPGRAPPGAGGPGSGLPRNVLSERERRKRISVSCERLRALLPQFEGRREDMASVLEMAVRFLQLARGLAPAWEQPGLHASRKDAWAGWPQSLLQLALAGQVPAEEPGGTTPQELLGCAVLGVEESKAAAGSSGLLDRLSPVPEPPSAVPRPPGLTLSKPPRLPAFWPHSLGQLSEEAPGGLGRGGPLARGSASPGGPAEVALVPVPGVRCGPGPDAEEGSFLLTASPDWWLGPLESRGGGAARSSPLDGAEPGFLGDPEPGPQEPQDGPLELWGSEPGCSGLALREEVDSIFPDLLAC